MIGGEGFIQWCLPSFVLLWAAIEMDLNRLLGPFNADQNEVLLFRGQCAEVPVLKGFHPRIIEVKTVCGHFSSVKQMHILAVTITITCPVITQNRF